MPRNNPLDYSNPGHFYAKFRFRFPSQFLRFQYVKNTVQSFAIFSDYYRVAERKRSD